MIDGGQGGLLGRRDAGERLLAQAAGQAQDRQAGAGHQLAAIHLILCIANHIVIIANDLGFANAPRGPALDPICESAGSTVPDPTSGAGEAVRSPP